MLYRAEFYNSASCNEEGDAVHKEDFACEGEMFVTVIDGAGEVIYATRYMGRFSASCFALYATKVWAKNVFCCYYILPLNGEVVNSVVIYDAEHNMF